MPGELPLPQEGSTLLRILHDGDHLSGNCEPSPADIAVTERMVRCGELMGIKMLDHIIIAAETGEQASFLRKGLLDGMQSRDDYTSEWER